MTPGLFPTLKQLSTKLVPTIDVAMFVEAASIATVDGISKAFVILRLFLNVVGEIDRVEDAGCEAWKQRSNTHVHVTYRNK